MVLAACANALDAGARTDVMQAVQEFVPAYSRSHLSGAAAAARATRTADGVLLEDAGREEDSECSAGLRRIRTRRTYTDLSDAQRQAAQIER